MRLMSSADCRTVYMFYFPFRFHPLTYVFVCFETIKVLHGLKKHLDRKLDGCQAI